MTTLAGFWTSTHPDTCPSLSLALMPSESFPSVIGAAVAPTPTLVVGTYAPDAAKVTFRLTVLAAGTHIICSASLSGRFVLTGTWSDPASGTSGPLRLTHDPQCASSFDGMWVGSAVPDPELAPFCIPVNPLRWVLARVPPDDTDEDEDNRILGAGFFNDAADVPGQPVLAFTLTGTATPDGDVKITKVYEQAEGMGAYKVHYVGTHTTTTTNDADAEVSPVSPSDSHESATASSSLKGTWVNPLGGSHGTFLATRSIANAAHFSGTSALCSVCSAVCPPDSVVFECTACPATAAHLLCPDCVTPEKPLDSDSDHPLVRTVLYTPHIVAAETCAELTRSALTCYADRPFIGTRAFGWLSYGDVASAAAPLASVLAPLAPNGRVVLLGDMSPAYATAMVSLLLSGVVVVPLDGALPAETLQAVVQKVCPAAVVSSKAYAGKVKLPPEGGRVHVYDDIDDDNDDTTGQSLLLRESEEEEGEEETEPVKPLRSSRSLSDVAALLFTSGSTGIPKGAIYTESMLLPSSSQKGSDTAASRSPVTNVGTVVRLDFQAFHPSFVVSLLGVMAIGGSRFIATDPATLLEDMAVARPTRISAPPLFWSLLRKAYDAQLVATGSPLTAAKYVRAALGNRVQTLISGGAALAPTTRDFFRTVIGVEVDDLLGSREAGPIARNGVVYPSVSPALLPLPLPTSDEPLTPLPLVPGTVGILVIASSRLIPAYFDDPEKTEAAFCTLRDEDDGTLKRYFITGDVARVVAAPGPLSGLHIELVGRAGYGCKLANSKWLAPSVLEAVLESHPWIQHALVQGSREANAPVAVVVLSSLAPEDATPTVVRAELCFWCTHHHAEFVIAAVHIESDRSWTHENGALTATSKKQRKELLRRYDDVLTELFRASDLTSSAGLSADDDADSVDSTVQLATPLADALSSALAVPSPLPRSLLSRSLVELGGDSLTLFRLATHLRSVGVPVTVPALQAYPVSHLDAIVRRASSSVTAAVAMPPLLSRSIDWDSALALGTLPQRREDAEDGEDAATSPLDRGSVLLTGGTGFLGSRLVSSLLADDRVSRLTLLVRGTHSKQDEENPRLSYVIGDLQQSRLGLADEVWDGLVSSGLGTVLHCGAKVNMVLGFDSLRAANCDSTRTLLHLAAQTGARMVYVSSVAVLPAAEFAMEGWLAPPDQDHLAALSGYAASKTVSEALVSAAAAAGVDVCVVRASMLGPGADGMRNPRDVLTRLLSLCKQLNTGPRGGMSLDWYPVDVAAADIVTLALASEPHSLPSPPVFHLAGTGPKLYEQLDADGVSERMEADDWRKLAAPALADDPLCDIILNMGFAGQRGVVPMGRTRDVLAKLRE